MMQSILNKIDKVYFWDVDYGNMDEQKSKRLIVERVMNFGNLEEIGLVIRYYGKEEVINTICKINYFDPKTLNFLSILFKIPKNKFKCYTRKPLIKIP